MKNTQQPKGNNKKKNKNSLVEQGTVQTQNDSTRGTKEKKKVKFPYKICGGDYIYSLVSLNGWYSSLFFLVVSSLAT